MPPNTPRPHPTSAAAHLRQRPRLAWAAAGLAISWCASLPAPAQADTAYPNKPITLVIPFPPGGSADTIGRLAGQRLAEELGQTVVIDNRPGGGTAIAAGFVARAPADGYTLFVSSGSTFTSNPAIRSNLPYDAVNSFDPVAIIARIPLILLAGKDVPASNVKAFAAMVKAAPDTYSYASFGMGTTAHFAGEIVLHELGAKMLHVPYKGSGPAMNDLIGGQVPFSFDTVTAALAQVKAGKVKAIAVTTAARSSQLPDVPTFAEAGYTGVNIDTWIMLVTPKGTPPPIREKLEKTLAKIGASPDAQAKLRAQGAEPAFAGAAAAAAQIQQELPLMRAVAQRANIKVD